MTLLWPSAARAPGGVGPRAPAPVEPDVELAHVLLGVDLVWRLVVADPDDPREPEGEARVVARALVVGSKATSRTIRGSTSRTKPRSSTVCSRNHRLRRSISASVSPE